jgi:hypothetical protein
MSDYDVFISHSSKDNEVVKRTLQDLRQDLPDVKFWVDFEALKPGDDWANEIIRNASGASIFLIFATEAAFQSNWVQQEIALGVRNHLFDKAPIIILAFDVTSIPPDLQRYQHINFANFSDGISRLKDFIADQFIPRRRTRARTHDSIARMEKATIFNFVSCPQILSGLSKAELRRRICKKLNRRQVSVLWFDVLENGMDDEIPEQPIQNCAMELILRSERSDKMDELFESLCTDHPNIASST